MHLARSLRPMLNVILGAESFLFSMLNRLEFDLAMTTSSLNCLKLESALRKRISDTIVPNSKMKVRAPSAMELHGLTSFQDILYVAVLGRGKVVTLIRPRKHSIHPAGRSSLCRPTEIIIPVQISTYCSILFIILPFSILPRLHPSFLFACPNLIHQGLSTLTSHFCGRMSTSENLRSVRVRSIRTLTWCLLLGHAD